MPKIKDVNRFKKGWIPISILVSRALAQLNFGFIGSSVQIQRFNLFSRHLTPETIIYLQSGSRIFGKRSQLF